MDNEKSERLARSKHRQMRSLKPIFLKPELAETRCPWNIVLLPSIPYPLLMVSESVTLSDGAGGNVIQFSEQGVQPIAQAKIIALIDRLRWDDLHTMRAIAEAPSIRQSATLLGVSPNTIRARLARLELALGTTMFFRDRTGLKITAEGRTVLQIALEMQALSVSLPMGEGNNALVKEGEIRICASEGLGTFWLTPRLLELKKSLPSLLVSLDSFSDQSRIAPRDHDLSIGFMRPNDQDAIVSKVGTVHLIPFASEDYIRAHGEPTGLNGVKGHHCVQQEAPGLHYDALQMFLGSQMTSEVVTFRVSSSYSLFWAVASGVGIGALPTYIRAISKRVHPISLPIQLKFDIWMSYSRAARKSRPVRIAIDWIRSSFNPARYPWFADEFVHPNAFGEIVHDSQVIPIFDHLIDGTRR
jgi:DNA-binding transcriptional LysR family regulator